MKHYFTKTGFYLLTMTLKDFSILLLLLLSLNGFSQKTINGFVSNNDGTRLSGVEVYNKNNGTKTITDFQGNFSIIIEENKSTDLLFFNEKYLIVEKRINATDDNLKIVLEKIINLSEVIINKEKEKLAAVNKLKDIDGTAIYAGKKTEVISLDKIIANKAINNPRQIFAQVVGLTINETSDGGLQLNVGGRGLNPNRTANFNTRQNGYDISADVLGYPESYYATPTEALEEIQIVRGAASLQYGTQFGGLINFKTKSAAKKPVEFTTRNTIGSNNLYANFSSVSGTNGKFSYYSFYNFKNGDGFRPNSEFKSHNYFANLNYQFTNNTSVHFDYTYYNYLAKQAGGLTDEMFNQNPNQSNRSRNWFAVNWNLFALRLNHKFLDKSDFSLQLFGLNASRNTVGFRPNRVESTDVSGSARDLIKGDFVNFGGEARYLKKYKIQDNSSSFLVGLKYYQSRNTGIQGPGSSSSDADFSLATDEFPFYANQSNYIFPNQNIAFFGENIFKIISNFSITPGFRVEKIKTQAEGSYRKINLDLAGNVILDETIQEDNIKDRNLVLLGVGLSYKPNNTTELYGNISQNYRSVTFNDIRTVNSNQAIAADITDEKGFTTDIGLRGRISNKLTFDSSVFGLYYNDKIGEYDTVIDGKFYRYRDNIGTAFTYGFETYVNWNVNTTFFENNQDFKWNVFINTAFTDSKYLKSIAPNIEGNKVEFVPLINLKSGTEIGFKNLLASIQLTYVSSQFTDATNSKIGQNDISDGISGEIPSYFVGDFSTSYKWKKFKLEAGISNFLNTNYFTRRATGYPGPGIIPSENRTFYTTLEFVF